MAASAAAVAAATLGPVATRADAACAFPTITVAPTSGTPGVTVTVSGRGFFETCNDTVPPGETQPTPATPDKGVHVEFVQGNATTTIATVNARSDYTFSVTVQVPRTAIGGAASFLTDRSPETAAFVVRTPAVATPRRGRATQALPRTGVPLWTFVLAAIGSITFGGGLLVLGRRGALGAA